MNTTTIETERLRLRAWGWRDLAALTRLLSDPEVMRFSDHGPLGVDAVRTWLEEAKANAPGGSALGMRAIALRSSGAVIGYVSLLPAAERTQAGDVELGVRLTQAHWRQGYAREAARRVIDIALQEEPSARVVGIVDPNNRRSVRMLMQLGMVYERDIMFDGYDYPDHLYVLSAPA